MKQNINTWTFSGRIVYYKELNKNYGASIRVRGKADDKDTESPIAEIGCLITEKCYFNTRKIIGMNKYVTVTGHFETFVKSKGDKTMLICDSVIENQ